MDWERDLERGLADERRWALQCVVLMAGISTESSNGNADVSREDFYVNAAVYWEVRFPGYWHARLLRNHYPKCVCRENWPFILVSVPRTEFTAQGVGQQAYTARDEVKHCVAS